MLAVLDHDALGRLKFARNEAATTGPESERYAYDALDRRDWKCEAASGTAACEADTR